MMSTLLRTAQAHQVSTLSLVHSCCIIVSPLPLLFLPFSTPVVNVNGLKLLQAAHLPCMKFSWPKTCRSPTSHWLTRAVRHTVYYGFMAISYRSRYCTVKDLDSPSNGHKASPQRPQAPCPSHDIRYHYCIALTSEFPLHSNYTANALVHTPQILVLDLAAFASVTTALVNATIATFATSAKVQKVGKGLPRQRWPLPRQSYDYTGCGLTYTRAYKASTTLPPFETFADALSSPSPPLLLPPPSSLSLPTLLLPLPLALPLPSSPTSLLPSSSSSPSHADSIAMPKPWFLVDHSADVTPQDKPGTTLLHSMIPFLGTQHCAPCDNFSQHQTPLLSHTTLCSLLPAVEVCFVSLLLTYSVCRV